MVRARKVAAEAESAARSRHDRAGLADAIALAAVSAEDQRVTARRLAEAGAIWREVGNALGEAKVDLVRASIDRGPGSAALRHKAERDLEMLGVRAHQTGNVAAGLLAFLSPRDRVAVRVQSLGGFSVMRDGELVKVSEWQSKRARELLKLLIARRGRPATRGYLMETLWPDDDPDRVANRLSVALTTVRGVLDPQRHFPPDHFVIARQGRRLTQPRRGRRRHGALPGGDGRRAGLPAARRQCPRAADSQLGRGHLRGRLPRGESLRRLGGARS